MIRVRKQPTGSYTFTGEYVNDDGEVQTLTAAGTLTVTDGAGASVYTGTPALAAGKLTATIPVANLAKLDTYTFTWTGTAGTSVTWIQVIELVGGYLFEIADLRTMDRAFTDTVKYPSATLRQVRNWVEDVIEGSRAAQVAFVPRGARVTLDGTSPDYTRGFSPLLYGADYRGLIVPNYLVRQVHSGSVNGTALTQAEIDAITISDNLLWRSAGVQWPAWPFGKSNITLHYEHGHDRTPGAITRAALILAREYLIKSDLPNRATATSIGDQLFRITVAGRDGITGIPDVDAAIDQFGRKGYGIG